MRALKGAIPRAHKDARTVEARAYRAAVEALRRRFPNLPTDASTWLREAGRLTADLDTIGTEIAALRLRNRRREVFRAQRRQGSLRAQLARIEDRLERLAVQRPAGASLAEVMNGTD